MFRQQLHGISALEAVNQLKREGMLALYRGILPPLLQKSVAGWLWHGQKYISFFVCHVGWLYGGSAHPF